jgi:hypothetical protein
MRVKIYFLIYFQFKKHIKINYLFKLEFPLLKNVMRIGRCRPSVRRPRDARRAGHLCVQGYKYSHPKKIRKKGQKLKSEILNRKFFGF